MFKCIAQLWRLGGRISPWQTLLGWSVFVSQKQSILPAGLPWRLMKVGQVEVKVVVRKSWQVHKWSALPTNSDELIGLENRTWLNRLDLHPCSSPSAGCEPAKRSQNQFEPAWPRSPAANGRLLFSFGRPFLAFWGLRTSRKSERNEDICRVYKKLIWTVKPNIYSTAVWMEMI